MVIIPLLCFLYNYVSWIHVIQLDPSLCNNIEVYGLLPYISSSVIYFFSTDALNCLSGLEKLEDLRLQNPVTKLSNPVCMGTGYKAQVVSKFPEIKVLDGKSLMIAIDVHKLLGQISRSYFYNNYLICKTTLLWHTWKLTYKFLNLISTSYDLIYWYL